MYDGRKSDKKRNRTRKKSGQGQVSGHAKRLKSFTKVGSTKGGRSFNEMKGTKCDIFTSSLLFVC